MERTNLGFPCGLLIFWSDIRSPLSILQEHLSANGVHNGGEATAITAPYKTSTSAFSMITIYCLSLKYPKIRRLLCMRLQLVT